MPIKPSPTIAGKLRKLFNNNKQTIEPAIGDSIPGGGGTNVLTLYLGVKPGDFDAWCYKDPECTEEYASYEEAKAAVDGAIAIKLVRGTDDNKHMYIPFAVYQVNNEDVLSIVLYYRVNGDGEFFDDRAGVYFEVKDPR